MASRVLDLAMLACLFGLGASLHFATPPESGAAPAAAIRPTSAFPPAPIEFQAPAPTAESIRSRAPSLSGDADLAISGLAQWATMDADPLRRTFANSVDLYAFMQRHLQAAHDGDGASAYYVYLALDECRPYLRLAPEEARALLERMQPSLDDSYTEERQAWARDSLRCYRFAGGDLSTLAQTLGDDRPGAESEYGSVFFERAADSAFPPALAERALREPGFDRGQREEMLRAALKSGNPDVFWQLFRRTWSPQGDDPQDASSLAWLIEACRYGYDCGSQAPWFRTGECADGTERCLPAQSALAHYWYATSPVIRDAAFARAQEIDTALSQSQWDDLPLPPQAEREMNEPTPVADDGPFM
jgi:hypothetical protein